ncbi:adenylate/guanylate cyclase domain-containing protein [Terrarubrum flagellatum]|uniref:adenylate/guanylate cyclase domain-containing protein n=1 Tax=Terrirubrum flagellatum TaxID=2895980 RepID=UPI003145665D
MSELADKSSRLQRLIGPLLGCALALGLFGLPVAVWLDLRGLSEQLLEQQARETGRIIDNMRAFYATEVVDRVLKANGTIFTTHQFRTTPNSIPIPATLSIELGKAVSSQDGGVIYRFISDLPFAGRPPANLDDFEKDALAALRKDSSQPIVKTSGSILDREVRIASPIIMGQVCVTCHNRHPESPKRDWKVGDVRGIQEIAVKQSIASNIFSFKYLLSYLALAGCVGVSVLALQRKQAGLIGSMNKELSESNNFLASISGKIARYLPPQVYKSIFSGEREAELIAERKKLTIFFSDIKNFTATAERLQPEDLTALLNEYLTEMSAIALEHGATVDKFIGDAILVFFGDPETKGVKEDALACVRMAIAMQRRLAQLNIEWRRRGIEQPFQARMGINTGFCNVGNFGSKDRMDYTIIGAEANLSARLQSIAEPGEVMLSYETYLLVREIVRAQPRPPIHMKGIGREIVPYAVEGYLGDLAEKQRVFSERSTGLDLYVDVDAIDVATTEKAKQRLRDALLALDRKSAPVQEKTVISRLRN